MTLGSVYNNSNSNYTISAPLQAVDQADQTDENLNRILQTIDRIRSQTDEIIAEYTAIRYQTQIAGDKLDKIIETCDKVINAPGVWQRMGQYLSKFFSSFSMRS